MHLTRMSLSLSVCFQLAIAAAVVAYTSTTCLSIACASTAQDDPASDLLVADFEGDSYGEWKVEGNAFGAAPAEGTLPSQMHVSGFQGRRLVNSFVGGDGSTGTLTSPPFTIERKYLVFLIGGGGHAGDTCMNLIVDDAIVRTSTGDNTQPGGSEQLAQANWSVQDLFGKTARLQIVDRATGGWGHINVDHIVQSDIKPPVQEFARREKSLWVDSPYLVIPIQNQGQADGRIQLFVDGREVRRYELKLAESQDKTDWHAFFHLGDYQGKTAQIVASKVTEEGFALIQQANAIPGESEFYREPHRPQFHFTQKVGWNNDPNGMVYHDGTWHFFFQHNPVGLPWGNMTWGHATSNDLLHWQQQPNKLFPSTMARGACFSGGATVDVHNTAGWGANALVAFLTDTEAGESIAYSTDGGQSFNWFEGNPVVKHQGRDPKVIWYAYAADDQPLNEIAEKLGGHWVMAVYDEHPEYKQNIAFYSSTDLKSWTEQSHLTGYFECPELFELAIAGHEGVGTVRTSEANPTSLAANGLSEINRKRDTRWIVMAADAHYALGTFDGRTFTPEHQGKHQVHWGPYYAAQTFDSSPDGRRIQVGWLRIDAPGPYNQHFSFPHQLTLRTTVDGIRLFANPIEEVQKLRTKTHRLSAQDLLAEQALRLPVASDLLDVRVEVELGDATSIELQLPGRKIVYDVQSQMLNEAPLKPIDGKISIQVLADRSLTEIVGNGGRVYISGPGPAKTLAEYVSITSRGGHAKLAVFDAHELASIWPVTQ